LSDFGYILCPGNRHLVLTIRRGGTSCKFVKSKLIEPVPGDPNSLWMLTLYSSPPISLKLWTFFNLGGMNLPLMSVTSISNWWIWNGNGFECYLQLVKSEQCNEDQDKFCVFNVAKIRSLSSYVPYFKVHNVLFWPKTHMKLGHYTRVVLYVAYKGGVIHVKIR